MVTRPLVQWASIAMGGVVLLSVVFVLGYGMVTLPLLFLLVAMIGGAVLYWKDGE
ncbi:MAG TPA: hypothetical protein VGR27_01420 [Longimicrobiaceae bacterium]|nr:hypothetical protein [Longimicrobiaceae bacterium]